MQVSARRTLYYGCTWETGRSMQSRIWFWLPLAALACAVQTAAGDEAGSYALVDARARAAPASCALSLDGLAAYLRQWVNDDSEKARAAFTWIAHNVVYDVSLRGTTQGAPDVLKSRRAACWGYAALFEALAEALGLEVEIIRGHAKVREYEVGQRFGTSHDHSWNAVKIEGEWRLADCTWGAGWLNDSNRFVPDFKEHYFLTPPEQLVYTHFPSDPKWQLLPRPLSEQECVDLPRVKPGFFQHGLQLVSHRSARIDSEGPLRVVLAVPSGIVVTARLLRGRRELDRSCTFAQREGPEYAVYVMPPQPGEYTLRLYACERERLRSDCDQALEYVVKALSAERIGGGYPKIYASFLERDCRLDHPIHRVIEATGAVEFSLSAPGAADVIVECGALQTHLPGNADRFAGTALVQPGRVRVFAKFAGMTKHEALLEYAVR